MTCSEKVFEEALQHTNSSCHSLFRSLPSSAHYQGPQCFSERENVSKLIFDPCQLPPEHTCRVSYSDGTFLILQCSDPSCAKWRRVDVATYDLFWTDWMNAQRAERRQNLTERAPMLISDLHVWLRELTATHFKPRPRAKKPRRDFRLGIDSVHAFFENVNRTGFNL